MTLACTSRHADDTPCQEQDPRHTVHHAHDMTGINCRMWVDTGDETTQLPAQCHWLPVDQIERRGNEAAAKLKARRERLMAEAIEDPSNVVLGARAERLRHEEARATGGLGLRSRHELRAGGRTPAGSVRELRAEISRLRADLAVADQVRQEQMLAAYQKGWEHGARAEAGEG